MPGELPARADQRLHLGAALNSALSFAVVAQYTVEASDHRAVTSRARVGIRRDNNHCLIGKRYGAKLYQQMTRADPVARLQIMGRRDTLAVHHGAVFASEILNNPPFSVPLKREVLERGAGGRWYGVGEDGSECDVGKVLAWEPPGRLVLAWQINADWQYDAGFVTEIEVTFTALEPNLTRVVLEHRDLHRYGLRAEELRKMIDAPEGWGITMRRFAEEASHAR